MTETQTLPTNARCVHAVRPSFGLTLLAMLFVACSLCLFAPQLADAQAPQIVVVDNDVRPASDGTVTIEAVVDEGGGLLGVDLRLRPDGSIEWLTQPMVAVDAQRFRAVVSPEQMAPVGIDYYVLAKSSDGVTEVTSPEVAPDSFYEVNLDAVSRGTGAAGCASAPLSSSAAGWLVMSLLALRRKRAASLG